MPGIIDAHSHSMMDGSVNECTRSVTSMARTQDILNPTGDQRLPRAGRRDDRGAPAPRLVQRHRWVEHDGQVQVGAPRRRLPRPRRAARHQVRARREPEAHQLQSARPHAALPGDPHGRRGDHPRRLHARARLQARLGRVPRRLRPRREEPHPAAPRPGARAAGRDSRRQALRPRALLPRRRDSDAHQRGRRVRLQDQDVPARPRRLQGGRRDRAPRRGRLDLRGLLGLQDGGLRRHPLQRRHPRCATGVVDLGQLRLGRARAPPQHRGREDDALRRADRRGGAQAHHAQPGHPARHRQAHRLHRRRQGRRPRRLERAPLLGLCARRADLRRRRAALRPRRRHRAASRARSRAQGARSGRGQPRARARRHAAAHAALNPPRLHTRRRRAGSRRRITSDEDDETLSLNERRARLRPPRRSRSRPPRARRTPTAPTPR